jgi:electron transfer flavoprotein beta subunit
MSAPVDDRDGPLVVACLRITDLRPEVDPLTGSVRRDAWGIGLSAADGAALEHALRIRDAWSGRLLAVAAGPATVEPVLREVAALGASVLRIPAPDLGIEHGYARDLGADEHELARTLAAALRPWGRASLVLCGDRSVDRGTGALPAFLAHELGAAQALGLVALEVAPAGDGVLVAGTRLRRASLAGALAAEGMTVPVEQVRSAEAVEAEEGRGQVQVGPSRAFTPRTRVLPAPEGADPRLRLLALTGALVSHDPPTIVGPVGSAEAADELVGFLVRHGYLDRPPDPHGAASGVEP